MAQTPPSQPAKTVRLRGALISERGRWQFTPRPVRRRIGRSLMFVGMGIGLAVAGPIMLTGWAAFAATIVAWPLILNSAVNVAMLRTASGVQPDDQARAARLLNELCTEMGIKREPRLTVLNTKQMRNAAALQVLRRDVLITVPLLHTMSDDQVKGVLAHELFHLRHHDTYRGLATYWGVLSGLQTFAVAGVAAKLAHITGGAVAGVLDFLLTPVAWTAMLGQVYWRERQADVSAARRTGRGPDLASALVSLAPGQTVRPSSRLRRVKARAAAIYSIAPHPPVWDRLDTIAKATERRQQDLARQVERPKAVAPAASGLVHAGIS